MSNEIWKDISGYEGSYKISNMGRVKSISRIVMRSRQCLIKERILKQNISNNGYARVSLKRKTHRTISVHRLVAENFINNKNLPEINHIDGNKLNNSLSNLEWCTHSENIKHAYRIGLKSQIRGNNNASKKVLNTSTGIIYPCITDAAEYLRVNRRSLSSMLNGKYKNKTPLRFIN